MKSHVTIRFYGELNDFLDAKSRQKEQDCYFYGIRSVKDLIESFSVPHVEVDLILVNGESAGFEHIVGDGDRVSVYPGFGGIEIGEVTKIQRSEQGGSRFVLDVHLGTLARYLRIMGFDADYDSQRDDPEIARIAYEEDRILLTRDRRLLMRNSVERGRIIRNKDPLLQASEVLERFGLCGNINPFTRCIQCNGTIESVPFDSQEYKELQEHIPPGVKSWCSEYQRCIRCGKIYWRGSHYDNMEKLIDRIMEVCAESRKI
ncbi:MAG: twitching motility protein PilT [Peptoclostridium sp.]|uniref:Mut7-C RNAse domain-containing protein n=1 Tax=Peptoclostridium sp. TaxID=1904860 RepID=UPI00139AC94D|nr:Mut7-C RNAse domain-containing protein [Peptoclostridium sp.]MZQ74707.1 twitching motility protein PilT [Peptoclostridium sp.]